MNLKNNRLSFTDVYVGMKIIDEDGDVGLISECTDPHNVIVEFINNGSKGFYCLIENCERDLFYNLKS